MLTNEQATTAALRNAFQTFLKTGAGKKDTVFILVAGHGTVDSRGAYILTYDSDPQDLSATAMPMAEIQDLVEKELSKVGRVVLLADVCRAATIGNLKTAAIGSAVEKLGEAPGEMLGLMAARPKEVSHEGPQYGGGHGAFTYSVLKGLQGAADDDDDQSVTAGNSSITCATMCEADRQQAASARFRQHGERDEAVRSQQAGHQAGALSTVLYDSRNGEPLFLARRRMRLPFPPKRNADVDAFQAAIRARRLLPDRAGQRVRGLWTKLRGELEPASRCSCRRIRCGWRWKTRPSRCC